MLSEKIFSLADRLTAAPKTAEMLSRHALALMTASGIPYTGKRELHRRAIIGGYRIETEFSNSWKKGSPLFFNTLVRVSQGNNVLLETSHHKHQSGEVFLPVLVRGGLWKSSFMAIRPERLT